MDVIIFHCKAQHEKQREERDAGADDACGHGTGDDELPAVARLVVHDALRWRQRGQGHGGESVHDEVHPKHLRHCERTLRAHEGTGHHGEACRYVDGELKKDETLYVLIERAAPHDGAPDGAERIVDDGDVAGLLGHARAIAHRQAHVGGFQRGCVVGAVAGDGHHLALPLQAPHEPALVHRPCAGYDFQLFDDAVELTVRKFLYFRSCDEVALGVGVGPDAGLPPDLTCCSRCVSCHYFHLYAGVDAFLDGRRHLLAHGVGDAHNAEKHGLVVAFHLIGKSQRAHGLMLTVEQAL